MPVEFHETWIKQWDAAEGIKEGFGTDVHASEAVPAARHAGPSAPGLACPKPPSGR